MLSRVSANVASVLNYLESVLLSYIFCKYTTAFAVYIWSDSQIALSIDSTYGYAPVHLGGLHAIGCITAATRSSSYVPIEVTFPSSTSD